MVGLHVYLMFTGSLILRVDSFPSVNMVLILRLQYFTAPYPYLSTQGYLRTVFGIVTSFLLLAKDIVFLAPLTLQRTRS